jgi:hypothetical protein
MAYDNLATLTKISRELEKLQVEFAFVGGAIVGFLLDNPSLVLLRATDDVDAIANAMTFLEYADLEKQLRKLGFQNDTSEGAPICRWIYEGSKVDVMPVKDHTGAMNDEWFEYAIKTAGPRTLGGVTVRTISAPCFVATKLAAFRDRGKDDYFGSHDLEDIITVVNGRDSLRAELEKEEPSLREFVATWFRDLLGRQAFTDALPGHLDPDAASQQRLPQLLQRMKDIAAVSPENS